MRALSTLELLEVWESGLSRNLVDRAQELLAVACPETPPEDLKLLSVGERDARLFTLRGWTFGSQAIGLATCTDCGVCHEFAFSLVNLGAIPGGESGDGIQLSESGFELNFRLPNSVDLAAIAGQKDAASARFSLFEHCLLSARRDGHDVSAEEIPEEIIKLVAERMEHVDPRGDISITLCCNECDRHWQEPFDIVNFFWTEIHAWACKTLTEVHSLASAYGWHEADILAMHPSRRQFYLEIVEG